MSKFKSEFSANSAFFIWKQLKSIHVNNLIVKEAVPAIKQAEVFVPGGKTLQLSHFWVAAALGVDISEWWWSSSEFFVQTQVNTHFMFGIIWLEAWLQYSDSNQAGSSQCF